jgi:hypothetical protein
LTQAIKIYFKRAPFYNALTCHQRQFFTVIEVDGSLSHITLIHPAAPELEKAAFQAISQWRYQPSTCVGVPIRVETMISTDFSLDL